MPFQLQLQLTWITLPSMEEKCGYLDPLKRSRYILIYTVNSSQSSSSLSYWFISGYQKGHKTHRTGPHKTAKRKLSKPQNTKKVKNDFKNIKNADRPKSTRIWHVPAKHANRWDARAHSSTLAECAPRFMTPGTHDFVGQSSLNLAHV